MSISTILGWMHLTTAIAALIFGSLILQRSKGTKLHARLGQAYCAAMTPVLLSAFSIYSLDGTFGIFHYAAIISSATLIAGLLPLYQSDKGNQRIEIHKRFMYWSVIGLYMALAAETLTRIPAAPFLPMVYLGSGIVFVMGLTYYRRAITLP